MVLPRTKIIEQIAPLIMYGRNDLRVYFIGSSSISRQNHFNASLSDVDLLFTPDCGSLNDYASHLKQIIRINLALNQPKDQLFECFMMSSRLAGTYFKILAVIAGDDKLRDEDIAFDGGLKKSSNDTVIPSSSARKTLYLAKSLRFYHEYMYQLPVADTSQARRVAKLLLRCLKLMICAKVDAKDLVRIEHELFSVTTFGEVQSMFFDVFGTKFDGGLMQQVLDGAPVDDWPAWMVAQDSFARTLMSINLSDKIDINDLRFYDGLAQVRDMLNVGLKNVLCIDDSSRPEYISAYADNTASIIVKLALSRVPSLADFETATTPELVLESYGVMIKHLKGDVTGLEVLAASVILLEYAFEQSMAILEVN